jgi:hypothetical protein
VNDPCGCLSGALRRQLGPQQPSAESLTSPAWQPSVASAPSRFLGGANSISGAALCTKLVRLSVAYCSTLRYGTITDNLITWRKADLRRGASRDEEAA